MLTGAAGHRGSATTGVQSSRAPTHSHMHASPGRSRASREHAEAEAVSDAGRVVYVRAAVMRHGDVVSPSHAPPLILQLKTSLSGYLIIIELAVSRKFVGVSIFCKELDVRGLAG